MRKFKTPAVVLVFLLCLCIVMAGCGDSETETGSVTSIKLICTGHTISGNSLTVNLSVGTLTFTADVQVTGKASTNFKLESSDSGIASVSDKTVTLVAAGKSTITATAVGDSTKKHNVTLTVVDNTPHSISVVGGSADKATAIAGQTVTLTPGTQAGQVFSDWTIVPAGVFMLSDNSFVMPASNVTVTGNFEAESTAQKPYYITNNFGEDTSTEFLVQWHNDASVTTQTLQVVTAAGNFTDATEIPVTSEAFVTTGDMGDFPLRNVFRAHVTGLSPNTRYKYRMGNTGAWSPVFYHLTSRGSFADFSFTVVTDPQNDEHSAMGVTLRAADAFDDDNKFYLMLGDVVNEIAKYPGEIVSYTNAANEFNRYKTIPATQGNHDTYHVSGDNVYIFGEATIFNRFVTFPDNGWDTHADKANRGQAYYFYYNNVLFIVLNTMATSNNTGTAVPNHTQQAAWLRKILEDDRANGKSKYTIVATHVSPFGGRSSERWLQPEIRAAYGPICTEYEVDLFFAGHDHVYGRTNPIKIETGNTALSAIDFEPTDGGTIYSIVSATGPKFYTFDSDTWVPQYFPVRTDNQSPGVFVNVKVTAEKLAVTAMRVGVNGEELDYYEVEAK